MSDTIQQKTELIDQAVKGSPAVGVVLLKLAGFSLNDWVLIATLLYVILQSGYLLHRWYRMTLRPNTRRHEEESDDSN